MKKRFIIKETRYFNELIQKNIHKKNRAFIIFWQSNQLPYNKYGISVGKKIGNAVTRNRLKRQVRAILSEYQKDYSFSIDCIIMVRKHCLELSYQEMKDQLILLLNQIGVKK